MYQILPTADFEKSASRLSRKNSGFKLQLSKTLKFMEKDITHPSLRLHKLSGQDIWSVSVNKSIRITLSITDNKIYLLEIGTHDEVY